MLGLQEYTPYGECAWTGCVHVVHSLGLTPLLSYLMLKFDESADWRRALASGIAAAAYEDGEDSDGKDAGAEHGQPELRRVCLHSSRAPQLTA